MGEDQLGSTFATSSRGHDRAGADVIFGHHAHRLQPFEMVNDAAVFWGLGNFVWPSQSDAGATTGIARVVVSPDGSLDACLIPAFVENSGQPVLTREPECGPSRLGM
jgi:poly-gamma-glutamate capsule biosynthesis protein CapA/YwtB (metallophosphatase superfamily)